MNRAAPAFRAFLFVGLVALLAGCGPDAAPRGPDAADPAAGEEGAPGGSAVTPTPSPYGPTRRVTGPGGIEGLAVGAPDAPLRVYEFADFQCPACRRMARRGLPRLMERFVATGRVVYVFVDLPLSEIHQHAIAAHVAARCAADQQAFVPYHHALYDAQREWASLDDPRPAFRHYARQLGLDMPAFEQCLDRDDVRARVRANRKTALGDLGIRQTPTFLVGNRQRRVAGQPPRVLMGVIEEALTGR